MMIQCQFGNTRKIWASKRRPDMLVAHLNGRFIANSRGSQFPVCCIKKYETLNNTFEWNDWHIYTLYLNVKLEAFLLTTAKWYKTNKTRWRRVRNDSEKWKHKQTNMQYNFFFYFFSFLFFLVQPIQENTEKVVETMYSKMMCKRLQRLTVGATLADCKWRSRAATSSRAPAAPTKKMCVYLLINAF